MKILHIHTTLQGGGIEAMICGLANEMSRTNDVTICTIFKPKSTDVFAKKIESQVQCISLNKTKQGFSLTEIFKILVLLSRNKYDVVHIHGFFYYYFLSVLFFHKRIKFFYTIHSDAYMECSHWDKKILWLKKLCFRKGWVRAVTISPDSQLSFKELYNCKSKLIYNGVATPSVDVKSALTQFRINNTTKVFFHAGRISKPKNQLVLCKVFRRLIDDGYDVALVIAGGCQDMSIYKSITPYFSERIHYEGEKSNVLDYMADADAMCLPSLWEGLPITLLEAFSVGCVPICAPVGGIKNVVVDGVNGLLSASSSEDDYYNAMKRYLELDSMQIEALRKGALKSFAKFDIKNISKEYLDYYSE